MFGTYNNVDPRNIHVFNSPMHPTPSVMGMNPYSSWHMNQNYYTPQPPLPTYYPPTPGMNYHNTFHGSPFDYQPTPYGGHPYPTPGQPMMDPYYGGAYNREPSLFDSCCPPRNPYDDHMLPPYQPQHTMRQSKPDHQHHQTSINSQSQSQSQTRQNRSSSQSQS